MPPLNAVIDLSHHNQSPDFQNIRDQGGILAIIHKATQGLRFKDPTYLSNKNSALSVGLFWGGVPLWNRQRRRATRRMLPGLRKSGS